jgi:hypothetical protein
MRETASGIFTMAVPRTTMTEWRAAHEAHGLAVRRTGTDIPSGWVVSMLCCPCGVTYVDRQVQAVK